MLSSVHPYGEEGQTQEEFTPLIAADKHAQSLDKAQSLGNINSTEVYSVGSLTKNFYLISSAFSLSTGCATCCISYATSLLGNSLGSTSSGLLFALYAISSFLVSNPVVTMIGPKNGLICGVIGQAIYICGFFVCVVTNTAAPGFSKILSVITSSIGGLAGGLLWTSQGVYFSTHAKLFAQSTTQEVHQVTADFSAIFAVVLLSVEMLAKILSSFLFHIFGTWGMFAVVGVFVLAAFVSCLMIFKIKSFGEKGTWDFSYMNVSRDCGAVARLVWKDSRLMMMMPFQLIFGYTAGYVPYYIFGTIVSESPYLGTSSVGFLSALVVLAGALVAIPSAYFSNIFGKDKILIVGAVLISTVGWPLFFYTNEQLGQRVVIILILICYGTGRGIWEVINKAVLVDFFAQDGTEKVSAAFSASSFANGYASGLGFFMFPYLSRTRIAFVCVVGCLFSLITFLFSFKLQKNRLATKALNFEREAQLDIIRGQAKKSREVHQKMNELELQKQKQSQSSFHEDVHSNFNDQEDKVTSMREQSGSPSLVPLAFGGGLSLINSGQGANSRPFDNLTSIVSHIGGTRRQKKKEISIDVL